jgi:hypothetical protein
MRDIVDAQDVTLLKLRAAALRERIALGHADPSAPKELALYSLTRVPDSGVHGQDDLDAALSARRAAPDDPEAWELLTLGLLVAGDSGQLADALRELEQRAPRSRALSAFRAAHNDPTRHDRSSSKA